MRYLLIPILVCAFGMSATVAMPSARLDIAGARAPNDVLLIAKKSPPSKRVAKRAKRAQKDLGGIHPLVGSGDY